jgi:hypothetical protein
MKTKTDNPKQQPDHQRIIGMDLHPDLFSAAALLPRGHDLGKAQVV